MWSLAGRGVPIIVRPVCHRFLSGCIQIKPSSYYSAVFGCQSITKAHISSSYCLLNHIRSGSHTVPYTSRTSALFSTTADNVVKRRNGRAICLDKGCSTQATYGWEGGRREFCGKHRKAAMVNVAQRRCEKCSKRATFGFQGERPTHCGQHSFKGMEDLNSKRCQQPGCANLSPTFGVPGGTGTYCVTHKKLGMEDVKNRRCEEPDCSTRATFGLRGDRPTHCCKHKGADSINVRSKRCEEPGCIVQASFGDKEAHVRRFCVIHKMEGMVSLTRRKNGKT